MAEQISDIEFVKSALVEGIMKLLPTEDTPGEPYWALFAVNDDGQASGNIWCPAPDSIVLFESKEEAKKLLLKIMPPFEQGPLAKKPSVEWAARGVTKEYLALLGKDNAINLFVGALDANGQLAARHLQRTSAA